MGEVYQARDPRLKRTVAIKTLRGYLVGSRRPTFVSREKHKLSPASATHTSAHFMTLGMRGISTTW